MRRVPAMILVCVLFSPPARGLDPGLEITQYVHDLWLKKDGLPLNSVRALAQDRQGYLWLATERGLVRFDGLRFTLYNSRNVPAFRSDVVDDVAVDPGGGVWAATLEGLIRKQGDTFIRIEGLPAERIVSLFAARDGTLWVGALNGLARIDTRTGAVREVELPGPVTTPLGFVEEPDGTLWIQARSLWRLRDGQMRSFAEEMENFSPRSIALDRDGTLWVGTLADGLGRVRGGTFRWIRDLELTHEAVFSLLAEPDGDLWIGTGGGGLNLLRNGKVSALTMADGFGSDQVNDILLDRQGNLWVATTGGGLNRLRATAVSMISSREGLPHSSVAAVYEDPRDGALWIGTEGGGLIRRQEGTFRSFGAADGITDAVVMAILRDRKGVLWVGTGSGLHRGADGGFEALPGTQKYTGAIFAIHEDAAGDLWIGGTVGVVRFREGEKPESMGVSRMFSAFLETDEGIWGAGLGIGMVRFGAVEPEILGADRGFPASAPLSIHEGADGTRWVGTFGEGLIRWRGDEFASIGVEDGLPDSSVFGILPDDAGNLWLCGNEGIYRIPVDELNRSADGALESLDVDLFGASEGMRPEECNGGSQNSAWRTRDGRLLFATPDGIAVVRPDRVPGARPPPPVVIESIECDGVRITSGEEAVKLSGGAEHCEIRYTALNLSSPERVSFRYRLLGLEDGWVHAGDRRAAYYTNLSPGDYRFLVAASNDGSSWSPVPAVAPLPVPRRFYQTFWFLGLTALVSLSSLFLLVRLRLRRLQGRQRELEGIVDARTRELAETNRNLEQRVEEGVAALRESERMAAYGRMVAGVAHEVRHPVFALQVAAYVLADRLREQSDSDPQVRTLELETRRLGRLMDDLVQFARPAGLNRAPADPVAILQEAAEVYRTEHGAGGPQPTIEASTDLMPVTLDSSRIVQVLVNLMENARKHAKGATRLVLSARRKDGSLELRIQDDGAGIDPAVVPRIFEPFYTTGKGSGLGLAIVRRIILDHGGAISAEPAPGGGTSFRISLPLEDRGGPERAPRK